MPTVIGYFDSMAAGWILSRFQRETPGSRHWRLLAQDLDEVVQGLPCVVREQNYYLVTLLSTSRDVLEEEVPATLLEVLEEWGHGWMWKSLRLQGSDGWLTQAIQRGTLRAVTDGSYIRELHPELCSAAFVLECSEGSGRMLGSFPELSKDANAYRGELLGLLAIHLILAAINKLHPDLDGSVSIYSDCLGAIGRVTSLPASRLPNNTRHSDILKIIMIHCNSFSFSSKYCHVKAHQDDHLAYSRLAREAQLNCQVDHYAKEVIWGLQGTIPPPQEMLPLEPVAIFAGKQKVTSGSDKYLRFWVHRSIAKKVFAKLKILQPEQFEEVAWEPVYDVLHEVPRLFQLWGCKQVMDIAGTNEMQSRYKENHCAKCPSCSVCTETCAHILLCQEEGRVDILERSIDLLDDWLIEQRTDTQLRYCIIDFAQGRGGVTMTELSRGKPLRFQRMAASQDAIGWRKFMEGMVSKELVTLHNSLAFNADVEMPGSLTWCKGLVVKLMEVTHGQWLYRNVHVHDSIAGALATERKEELLRQ